MVSVIKNLKSLVALFAEVSFTLGDKYYIIWVSNIYIYKLKQG